MDTFDISRLAYLLLLAVAIGGYLMVENRRSLGRMARQAMAWGLIFVGVIVAYGMWNDISRQVTPRQAVVAESGQIIAPRQPDGHFYLTLRLNGQPIEFVVDTGASDIVLTRDDARRIGIDLTALAYTGSASTANGAVRTARTRIDDITLGGITDRNIPAVVNAGDMEGSLLGMTYLRRFSRIEIAGDQLILTR